MVLGGLGIVLLLMVVLRGLRRLRVMMMVGGICVVHRGAASVNTCSANKQQSCGNKTKPEILHRS